jgi:hypothetical protein
MIFLDSVLHKENQGNPTVYLGDSLMFELFVPFIVVEVISNERLI